MKSDILPSKHFISTNGINLHYLYKPGKEPALVMMHGLTANAVVFNKLSLELDQELFAVDLRGRGLSDKPEHGYTMGDHALDIIGLLNDTGKDKVVLCGHSFGALLSLYLAYHYPDRVDKIIMIDAAANMHPDTRDLLIPALARLDATFPSFNNYLDKIKLAPYQQGQWDDSMIPYYRADVEDRPDGSVKPRSVRSQMEEAVEGALGDPWFKILPAIPHQVMLLNATEPYGPAALLPREQAMETVQALPNGRYVGVPGNHLSMMFEKGASSMGNAIKDFLAE